MLTVREADVASWEKGTSKPSAEAARQLRIAFGEPPAVESPPAESAKLSRTGPLYAGLWSAYVFSAFTVAVDARADAAGCA